MKILQLVTKRQYRGAEVFAANLSEELLKLGHEIIFAGLYTNGDNILSVEGATNIDLVDQKSEGISPQLVSRVIELIKTEKPDVIQCNGSDTLKYMVSASYFVPKVPIVYRNISTISEWLNSGLKKEIYRQIFKKVDFVTSVGNESINDLIDTFNYPKDKTAVIRRGIPFKEFDPQVEGAKLRKELQLKATDHIIIHVGNFSPEKNHSFLLDVFSEIKKSHPNVKLVCVGNGITFPVIHKEIIDRNLEDTVFLLGFRKEIPQLLAGSDCFVLSSLVEGVPGVILEAAVQKKPSIATNVGGVLEVIRKNETGIIIDDFDKEEFRLSILKLVEDEKLRNRLGKKAYNLVREEFDSGKNAVQFEGLYNQLIWENSGKLPADQKPKRLRILQIIQKQQYRGAEIFSCQLSNHLVQKGHEVKVFSIYGGQAELPFEGEINSFNRDKTSRYLDMEGWKSIAEVVKDFNPHIVQANASDTLKYTVFSKTIFGWKTPIVYRNASVSSYYIKDVASKMWNRELMKRVDKIISVSHWSKKDLNMFFPFTRNKSEVITIGVEEDTKELYDPFDHSESRNIVHVGSLTKEKNHKDLLLIFKEVVNSFPEARLHIIGEGPLRKEILFQINKLLLTDKVKLHGEIKDPVNFIKFSDILVLPSMIEGLPAVILEAMFYKTPVVAYSVGGISEILNENTGFPVTYGDKEKFINSIKDIFENHPIKKITLAKDQVNNHFLNKNLVDKFIKSYYDVI